MIHFHATRDDVCGFGNHIELRCMWRTDREGDALNLSGASLFGQGTIEPVQFRTCKDGEFIPPFLRLTQEQAQQLVDALWKSGIQPSNGAGSVGQRAATERHLADMRKVAFNKLGIKEA